MSQCRLARHGLLELAMLLIALLGGANVSGQEKSPRKQFAIALHGGAGSDASRMSAEKIKAVETSLGKALDLGVEVVKGGGTGLDAVEKVIRFLEDDPLFNAGRGAVFNAAGGHELDASIMDGKTLGAAAWQRSAPSKIPSRWHAW